MPMKPATLLMFWDYDTQWGGDRSRAGGGPRDIGRLDFENTERLLDLHARYGIPACFAVVGAAAMPGERPYHDPRQIRRIHEAGHEVGSHSFRHEWLPGLDRAKLTETLRASRWALEDCIGARVSTFVPPFNQPFDYPAALSFSLSERREAGRARSGVAALCDALVHTGYRVCRLAYRSLLWRGMEALAGRRLDRRANVRVIGGVRCVKLNTPCGFAEPTRNLIERGIGRGGVWVVYGHPHSASEEGPQSFRHLERFLRAAASWRDEGTLRPALPGRLVDAWPAAIAAAA
jgi:peptidoglycan/xylan/chitin deacetylase (PgdA/CDA1 family)